MNIQWDANRYTNKCSYVYKYGEEVLELLHTARGGNVIDLGCGNGALTQKLADAGMQVVGMDDSEEQLAIARATYPALHFKKADATNFKVEKPVDAIFSNAVFHWIDERKQNDLLHCVTRALKTGGELVCELGGEGNVAQIQNALKNAFEKRKLPYVMPFFFPSLGGYAARIERCGLRVVFATLFDRPTELKDECGLADWIYIFMKKPFMGIDEKRQREIIDEVANVLAPRLFRNGNWYADYVRLRLRAVKKIDS